MTPRTTRSRWRRSPAPPWPRSTTTGAAAGRRGSQGWRPRLLRTVDHKIERGAEQIEEAFEDLPISRLVSGGPGSAVAWDTLSRQGRRNVATAVRPEQIEQVMGEPAVAEPIRVFVGLESAPTKVERVALALAELERTGAFDRELLMVISPTGTGSVNYGNIASVTMQYSLRPSPLSLDRWPRDAATTGC